MNVLVKRCLAVASRPTSPGREDPTEGLSRIKRRYLKR
jgi:hypothetical protein